MRVWIICHKGQVKGVLQTYSNQLKISYSKLFFFTFNKEFPGYVYRNKTSPFFLNFCQRLNGWVNPLQYIIHDFVNFKIMV